VLALALGLASAVTLYTAFRVVANDLPPIPHPERVARLYLADETMPMGWRMARAGDRAALVEPIADRTSTSVVRDADVEVAIDGCAREDRDVTAEQVEPAFFDIADVSPQLGRSWTTTDLGNRAPALLSADLWRRACGADPSVVGRTVWVDRQAHTVTGVMPDGFRLHGSDVAVWLPLGTIRPGETVTIYARLTGRGSWQAVNDRLAAEANARGLAVALTDPRIRRGRIAFVGLLGPALLVLLVACGNAAALLVGRTLQRRRELGIRLSVGASPWRLAGEAFTEAAVVALAAGLAALPLAEAGAGALRRVFSVASPAAAKTITIDAGALAFGLAVVVTTALLTGLLPAWRAAGTNVTTLLAPSPPPVIVRRGHYTGPDLLVVLQVGLAVVLLVVSAMFLRFVGELVGGLVGPLDRTFVAEVQTLDRTIPDPAALRRLTNTLRAVPGVVRVSVADTLAAAGSVPNLSSMQGQAVETLDAPPPGRCAANVAAVTADYFETFPIPLRAGDLFTGWESTVAPRVAVVSEGMARRCWGQADAVGRRLRIRGDAQVTRLVVGVVADAMPDTRIRPRPVQLYVPYAQGPGEGAVLIVETRAPAGMAPRLEEASRSTALRQPRWETLAALSAERGHQARMVPRILQGLAVVALLLATLGVYASIAQSLTRERRSLAIRLALGARPLRLVAAGVSRQATLSVVGTLAGVLVTVASTREMFTELLQMTAPDPGLWLAICAPLVACGVLASLGPAIRIVRLDPIAILRRADE
jgi:putative ABC transport system permease protein